MSRVKQLSAILFSVLLMLPSLAPVQASACDQMGMKCPEACRRMPCCAAKNSDSRHAPAVPAPKTAAQNQFSFLAAATVIWTAPANPANAVSSFEALPVTATVVPLYERNCTLLI